MWTVNADRVENLLDSAEIYENHIQEANDGEGGTRRKVEQCFKWVIAFDVVSLVAAICKAVFYDRLWGWSLEYTILDQSQFVAEVIFGWETPNPHYWHINYGADLTPTTITLGSFGILIECCYRLLLITIKDTMLILIVTLGSCVQAFINRIIDFANLPLEEVCEEDCNGMNAHYETYLKVKDIVLDMNWAFGDLINLLHVGNELFLAYFMKSCLEEDPSEILLLWMLFTIVKVIYGYIKAAVVYRHVSTKNRFHRFKVLIIFKHNSKH